MRRVCPAGRGVHSGRGGEATAPGTAVTRMPPGCMKPLSLTMTWLAVNLRCVPWLNCTLARSTCGHVSPDPMVSAWFLHVAVAPTGGVTTRPFWSRYVTHTSTRELGIMTISSTQTGTELPMVWAAVHGRTRNL